jgi:hypothetical protein
MKKSIRMKDYYKILDEIEKELVWSFKIIYRNLRIMSIFSLLSIIKICYNMDNKLIYHYFQMLNFIIKLLRNLMINFIPFIQLMKNMLLEMSNIKKLKVKRKEVISYIKMLKRQFFQIYNFMKAECLLHLEQF